MSELVAFLEQRLAEDEAVARAATPGPWDAVEGAFGSWWVERPETVGDIANAEVREDAAHVARHDPARVLREVTAKRAILAKYQRAQAAYERMVNPASTAAVFALAEVVQHMAAPFSDHPDFQEQWR